MLLKPQVFARLCRARDMLDDVQKEDLSVHGVAREIEMSRFHFIRQFESVFGLTPHQFRIRSRIDQAKYLLELGELTVTDVCMEVGFSSLGTFSDLFSRRVGTPPSSYRRAMVQVPEAIANARVTGCLGLMALLPKSTFRNFREARASGPP